jgi:hypothetical protein
MHRSFSLFLLTLLLASCVLPSRSARQAANTSLPVTPAASASPTPEPEDTPTAAFAPTAAYTVAANTSAPPASPAISWLEQPNDLPASTFSVRIHPEGALYVGDQVSIEVIPPDGFQPEGRFVTASLEGPPEVVLRRVEFGRAGLGNRLQATLLWAWDTTGLAAGEYNLKLSVEPDGPAWSESLHLLPRGQLPPGEQGVRWARAESDCCLVYYFTGSAAERDLQQLLEMFDHKSLQARQRLGVSLPEPVEVTLLPRLIGHGGFANGGVMLSYLDRNYAGGETAVIFQHELVHLLDARLGGALRPPFLVEGFAVYQAGGHFKLEPLMERAAALLPPKPGCSQLRGEAACGLDLYIPLNRLAADFYTQQHETGYLESAALVEFMVSRWGETGFSSFYRDIQPIQPGSGETALLSKQDLPAAVDMALVRHFGLSLADLEAQFLQALREQPLQAKWVEDVHLTLRLYDRARAYQQQYDTSAYFLNAWLPDGEQMRRQGILADYLRSSSAAENLALETMLVAASADLQRGTYQQSEVMLEAASSILAQGRAAGAQGFRGDGLPADYYSLAVAALDLGFMPQRILLNGDQAQVWASREDAELEELGYQQFGEDWYLRRVISWLWGGSPPYIHKPSQN